MFQKFNNQSLRKLVIGFGALFNEIYVDHENPTNPSTPLSIRVPITYAPQEKFIRRLLEPSSINDATRIENQLPRLSYIMTNVAPDASRRRSKFNTLEGGTLNLDTNQCEPTNQTIDEVIPVNVGFNLFIYTRHIDDTLQIVEQILPYFSPDHIIQIDMNAVQQGVRIPIIMTSNNITEKYDGDFGNRRINISSISFVAKAFIYGPIKGITTIQNTDLNLDLKDNNYYE